MDEIRIKKPKKRKAVGGKVRSSEKAYEYKSDILLEKVAFAIGRKREVDEVIEVDELEPTLDENLFAFVKDCKKSSDGKFIILVLDIFEEIEPIEISFAFNISTSSVKYLLQNAKKFKVFRETGNFVELIGCPALVKVGKNNGYLNLTVIKELEIKELDFYLMKLENEAKNAGFTERQKRFHIDEDEDDEFDEEDDEVGDEDE